MYIDISNKNLYITKIHTVITSDMLRNGKLRYINNRHSDCLVYILHGSCTYESEGNPSFTVHEGDILYLSKGAVYTMDILSEKYNVIFCDFDFEDGQMRKCDVYSPKNVSDAENLFRKLLKCYTYPSENSFTECMSILYKIYGIILISVNSRYIGSNIKKKMSKIKDYIDANYKNSSISVTFLAQNADISEVYLRKLFKSMYGISPSKYIVSARIKNAKKLMKYPFLSLEECALQSGFSSLQYFCRVFKKSTGTTPAKYRNEKY